MFFISSFNGVCYLFFPFLFCLDVSLNFYQKIFNFRDVFLKQYETFIILRRWFWYRCGTSNMEESVTFLRSSYSILTKCSSWSFNRLNIRSYCDSKSFFLLLDLANNESMKEIKGLSERLESLQHRLVMVKQIVEDQTVMAKVSIEHIIMYCIYWTLILFVNL